jgi:hypothetical protein
MRKYRVAKLTQVIQGKSRKIDTTGFGIAEIVSHANPLSVRHNGSRIPGKHAPNRPN